MSRMEAVFAKVGVPATAASGAYTAVVGIVEKVDLAAIIGIGATVVCPATTGVIWRTNVAYRLGL